VLSTRDDEQEGARMGKGNRFCVCECLLVAGLGVRGDLCSLSHRKSRVVLVAGRAVVLCIRAVDKTGMTLKAILLRTGSFS
jgi:hypothetical protein